MTTLGAAPEVSAQPNQLEGSLSGGVRQTTSTPSKSHHAMISDLPPSFPPAGQYHTAYQDPAIGLGPFVDMDGYGPPRRQQGQPQQQPPPQQQQPQQQRIAPDLDALFDELASLDGAEKPDNQPEFMQNLGFVADPEIYSLFKSNRAFSPRPDTTDAWERNSVRRTARVAAP
ncbi:hypothetical protein N7462_004289 [Penicillium macrosclerotiorum]|uniref:uncharacterized protein n=1 Tax=Penicillium macrosclerotiorum TaxID=303699 RepID=UPI002548BBF5|nr:uncharacterized protein N7462_004289 [Penicillium macrosclerotiorum]KAJ5689897.1 hypothetical protein N7462_004289 [Penicillium macrosclerotiorum]